MKRSITALIFLLGLALVTHSLAQSSNASDKAQGSGAANGQGSSANAGPKSEGQALVDRLTDSGKALDLNYTKSEGKGFALSRATGVPTVLYFWSGRDRASVEALLQIRAAAAKFSGATFIGVNVDQAAGNNTTAPDGVALPGTQTWMPDGLGGDVPRRFAVGRIPAVYVFNVRGQLHGVGAPRDLDVLLRHALK